MKTAGWQKLSGDGVQCLLCPHNCILTEGGAGICRARRNIGGTLIATQYAKISAMALDPVEKKPLRHFFPGKSILSIGGAGCNMHCPYCQNHRISMGDPDTKELSPYELADIAESYLPENIGVAYTYNEPLINYEYLLDCAAQIKSRGMRNVLVTNGMINPAPLEKLLPHIDAMNIDLKCFSDSFYKKLGGNLEAVKQTISSAAPHCHIEVTTLIIPSRNDTPEEMESISRFIAGINSAIPLHISRFFPNYNMPDTPPTPAETMYLLEGTAKKHLSNVYLGNI